MKMLSIQWPLIQKIMKCLCLQVTTMRSKSGDLKRLYVKTKFLPVWEEELKSGTNPRNNDKPF